MHTSTLPAARMERAEAHAVAEMFSGAPDDVVRELGLGWEWVGESLVVWASKLDVLMFNRALHVGQAESATEYELAAIAARFDGEGVPRSFLQLAPEAEPAGELEAWARARGWAPYNRWVRFSRALVDLPAPPEGVSVKLIGSAQAETFASILTTAFNMPPVFAAWERAIVGRPNWTHYLAYVDGEPVGCAAAFGVDDVAWCGKAGTLESARGRGVQSALIARRLADAADAGHAHVVVETADDTPERNAPSYRNQLRHGFELRYKRDNWLRAKPA
jgi:GNAT superfamily N-acetyltransferase